MKNKTIILIIILLILLFIGLTIFFSKEKYITDSSEYDIKKILELDIILSISEIYYGPDIDLYSTRDEYGNEWIYKRTSKHIVLTNNGVLCQYTSGSYREEIKYSRIQYNKSKRTF